MGVEREAWAERAAARIDPELDPAVLAADAVAEVYAHARECYPEECCGLLLGQGETRLRAVRCSNVQNQRHARGESKLDARKAFWIDERELVRALREAEAREERLLCVYHSHVDTAAYLSHTDLAAAVGPNGTPAWPGTDQLVVSVFEDGVREAALFSWDAENGAYRGRPLRSAP